MAKPQSGLEITSIGGEGTLPRVVTKDNPLVITSTNPSFEWIQIMPEGEIRVQVNSAITIKKLEKKR
jgi:hypothetical protein